ncbi:class I SAM-dependent methyltransferase [Methanotorris igneus]|uniref:Methyltransferase type 12 n=1 Tax=Methanotorris igneus (strain DSM 5666 / JCM 11834 / Kol 5) TaxID=880724 RepID=F6BAA9_METIK|nr:class I SAM-dependent methyltransferase [Methanotorris igneus]AEF95799.1 Methyltransferase type 12 [Methanotorris igneus Kol 5]
MKFNPQVPHEHYINNYDKKHRWISYWYQINEVISTKPQKVLEIGPGNGTISNYLKKICKINVTTVDIDKNLNPDYVCSVTELKNIFKKDSFDTVLCAQVLEHLPFRYFEESLKNIQYVTKNYAIITLPHYGINISFKIKILFGEFNFVLCIPYPKEHKFDGQHYWEIGKKGYSLRRIEKIISKYFIILKNYLIPEHPYHRVFVLKKF